MLLSSSPTQLCVALDKAVKRIRRIKPRHRRKETSVKNATTTPASTTASDTARALSVAATAAAASLNSKDFAALTKSLVKQWQCANAEKGDKRVRAVDACRVFGAALLTETLSSGNPHGIRLAVTVLTKERGTETESVLTCGIISILKAIVFGGNLIGASKLAK
jgi:hypothetical protein